MSILRPLGSQQQFQCPQPRQVSSRGSDAKETQEEILKALARRQAKTEHMDIVLNGPRMASARRFEQLQARLEQKRKTSRSRSTFNETRRWEDTRKVMEKEISKGKDPKVPVRQESQASLYATIFTHGTVATRQNAHTSNPKVAACGGEVHRQSRWRHK